MNRQIVNALAEFVPELVDCDLRMTVHIKLSPKVETSMWMDMGLAKSVLKVLDARELECPHACRLLLEVDGEQARILAFIHIIDDERMYMIAEPTEEPEPEPEPEPVDDPGETEESIDDIIEQGQTGLDDVLEGDE